jgi:hypothetical protein
VTDLWQSLPEALRAPVALAAPFILLFIALEGLVAYLLEDERPETARPTNGLTTPVGTHNLLTVQTHEYAAITRDVRSAPTVGQKLGYVFGPPGWRPLPAAAPESLPASAA